MTREHITDLIKVQQANLEAEQVAHKAKQEVVNKLLAEFQQETQQRQFRITHTEGRIAQLEELEAGLRLEELAPAKPPPNEPGTT